MKLPRPSLFCCFATSAGSTAAATTSFPFTTMSTATTPAPAATKRRRSASLAGHLLSLTKRRRQEPPPGAADEESEEDNLIGSGALLFPPPSPTHSTVIGTIYGHRRGRVSLCMQPNPSETPPFLLELSVPTCTLVQEMQTGPIRLALEFCRRRGDGGAEDRGHVLHGGTTRVWKAYCNGRKVGYAVKRRPTERDREILRTVRSTSAGAGLLFVAAGGEGGEVMYMRASYERVVGSRNSVSYHLINPAGSSPGDEMSIFLLRTT